MANCPKCGWNNVYDGAHPVLYCLNCGAPITMAPPPPPQQSDQYFRYPNGKRMWPKDFIKALERMGIDGSFDRNEPQMEVVDEPLRQYFIGLRISDIAYGKRVLQGAQLETYNRITDQYMCSDDKRKVEAELESQKKAASEPFFDAKMKSTAAIMIGMILFMAYIGGYFNFDSGGTTGGGGGGVPGYGTLSVSDDQGNIYVSGTYIGKGHASVTLPAGDYTVSCYNSVGSLCWQQHTTIYSGKTSSIKSNTYCR